MWPKSDGANRRFYETFGDPFSSNERLVPPEWQDELARYFIYGLPPGSFHTALFENNLMRAALTTHPANTWTAIVNFMKWLSTYAPTGSWGSKDNVQAWLKQGSDECRRRCEEAGILETPWEILQRKD